MECVVHPNNEGEYAVRSGQTGAIWSRPLKRKLSAGGAGSAGGARGVQLDVSVSVPRAPARQPMHGRVVTPRADDRNHSARLSLELPFMSNMDEISYWIYTKRAPCLMNYDMLKKQEEAQSSKAKPKPHVEEVPSPKKKKRKLSILARSVSTEKGQDVYYEAPKAKRASSCKSSTLTSDVDFNIKNSSVQDKPKKNNAKKGKNVVHKKNKVITSTPKVTSTLRRSLRNVHSNVSHLNHSVEVITATVVNGDNLKSTKSGDKSKKSLKIDHVPITESKETSKEQTNGKTLLNGHFEDLSDVSGFTANYIRSTKLNPAKSSRNLRTRSGRNLVKDSQCDIPKGDSMVMCVNKSMNTGLGNNLNCSTGSSQNIVNLVTRTNNKAPPRTSRSTSILKFMDPKSKTKESESSPKLEKSSKINLNASFQTVSSSTSRYPKRQKNQTVAQTQTETPINLNRRRKSSNEFNDSDRKENPMEQSLLRTRSGRCVGLALRSPDNSVLVVSNSEQVSSMATMNVATPQDNRRRASRPIRGKKSTEKRRDEKDSLRDKSGFAACFSDSDEGSEVKQKKYFC